MWLQGIHGLVYCLQGTGQHALELATMWLSNCIMIIASFLTGFTFHRELNETTEHNPDASA